MAVTRTGRVRITSGGSGGSGGAPTGAAGGSLTGTYPNPTIATIPSGATATTQSAADNSTKVGTTAYVDTGLALKANIASPTLTGTPLSTTAAQGTNTTQIATTAMVHSEAVLLAPIASPTFTGTVVLPEGNDAAAGTASRRTLGTGAAQAMQGSLAAPLASPALTGTPTVPTATAGTASTQAASTAYADAIGDLHAATPLPTTPAFLAETFPRYAVAANAASSGTTGVCVVQLIYLRKGMVVSNLNVLIGATVAAVATHWWMALTDVNRVMVAVTADNTAADSGTVANTVRTQAIATIASGASSTYTVPTSGYYYLLVNSTAGTVPTFIQTTASSTNIMAIPPIVCATSETLSTGPPAFTKTFGALATTTKLMYGGVS